jgi:hypothetical protein
MWHRVDEIRPPINVLLDTKIEDERGTRCRNVLRFHSNLWWDRDVYVYYTPTHWRTLT